MVWGGQSASPIGKGGEGILGGGRPCPKCELLVSGHKLNVDSRHVWEGSQPAGVGQVMATGSSPGLDSVGVSTTIHILRTDPESSTSSCTQERD